MRVHHIYKPNWTPKLSEMLRIEKDNRQKALTHALNIHKNGRVLAGCLQIELSRILQDADDDTLYAID